MSIYLYRNGQQEGPYDLNQIRSQLRAGLLSMQDSAWFEGCEDWSQVSSIPGLIPEATPPPVPAKATTTPSKKVINKKGAWCPPLREPGQLSENQWDGMPIDGNPLCDLDRNPLHPVSAKKLALPDLQKRLEITIKTPALTFIMASAALAS